MLSSTLQNKATRTHTPGQDVELTHKNLTKFKSFSVLINQYRTV